MKLQPTSALDQQSEKHIQSALRNLRCTGQQKTCLVVAHRLSTIEAADVIYVLKGGRIIESGTHDHLMAQHAAYYELACKQITSTTTVHATESNA